MDFLGDLEEADKSRQNEEAMAYVPSISDLLRYFRNARVRRAEGNAYQPLVGEEKNALSAFMAYVMARRGVIMKSLSGAGKSVIIDTVSSLIPEHRIHMIDMGSNLSVWAQAPEMNNSSHIMAEELQNHAGSSDEFVKIAKKILEGKPARRVTTDVTQRNEDGNYGANENVIWPKPLITAMAIENDTAKGVYNDEMARRVIELTTDISEEQTRKIIEMQLKLAEVGKAGVCDMDDDEVDLMVRHVEQCISKYDEIDTIVFPGAGAMNKGLPATFVDSRSTVSLLLHMMKGFALWNFKNRIIKDGVLFMTPEDLYNAMEVYGETFVYKSLRVDLMAQPILKLMPDAVHAGNKLHQSSLMTVTQIVQKLKSMKIGISKKKVQTIMDNLEDNGLVERGTDGITDETQYYKTGLSKFDALMDYRAIYKRCEDVLGESYSEVAEDYKKRYLLDKTVSNPVTGKTEVLF